MYQALYRKWRPCTFDDVVGQEHITTTLKNEVATGKLSHAYLFCGTRGTGKTSCAKIFAKAVNCLQPAEGNPCCQCEICKGIDSDSAMDVTEIDAASNSGVENIRELREEAFFTPATAKFRVYIIDECHMLSTGAFNALLKIMEEPPAHVLFILATTEIHKVPATILSRCQRFDFKRIDSGVIRDRLLYVAGQENADLAPEAAMLIARLCDGGMRDALSLLDLCLSDGAITTQTVSERAGLVGQAHLFLLANAANSGDAGASLAVLEDLWKSGVDYQRLCEQLIGFYRNLMVAKSAANPQDLIACLPDELEQYRQMAKTREMPQILYSISVLQDTLSRMSKTPQRRAELEMGLLRLAAPQLADTTASLLKRVEKLELAIKNGVTAPAIPKPEKPKAEPAPTAEEIRKTPVEVFDRWEDILSLLKEKNAALYGTLANSVAYTGGELFLVDAGDSMFASMVRSDGYAKESLRDAVIAITGKKYRLGPYNPAQHEVQSNPSALSQIMEKADTLGASIEITE